MLVQIIVLTLPDDKLILQANVPAVLRMTFLIQEDLPVALLCFHLQDFLFYWAPYGIVPTVLSPVFYPCFAQRFFHSSLSLSFMLSVAISFSMFWSMHLVTKLSACLKNDFTSFQSPFELYSPVLSVFWHLPSPAGCSHSAVILQQSINFSSQFLWNTSNKSPLTHFSESCHQ